MRAVILDDDQVYLQVAMNYLDALGASEVQVTTDPVEASDILHNEHFDLVMVDLNMPGCDGLAFLRSIAEAGFEGAVIIVSGEKSIIVSSSGQIGEKLGLNVCGTLAKPLDMAELKRAYECAKTAAAQFRKSKPVAKLVPKGLLTPIFYYQPQIDVDTGDLEGVEALLRGIDQEGHVFGPNEMLSNCRSGDECFEMTKRLFELFCSDVVQMRQQGFQNRFAFNVDAANLEFPQFAEMLMETTSRHQINTKGIVIELIESHLPDDETWLLEVIARLSMAGFEIAMDDFSTGASSFDLLKAGAFAEIKLDVALVQNSADDLASAKFITSTLEIAKDLGTRVIAEGVETEDDLIRMKNMGVECVQGFLIARPSDRSNLKTNYGSSAEEKRVAS